MNEWINVKDRLPLAGQEILFCSLDEEFLPTTFGLYLGDNFKDHRFYGHSGKAYNATHWMTLPEHPKSQLVNNCPLYEKKVYILVNKLDYIEHAYLKVFRKLEDADKFRESLGNAAQYYLIIPVDVE